MAGVVAALLVIVLAIYAVSRWLPPERAQRDALARVDTPPQRQGRNGFALLWAVQRDVPEGQVAELLARDVARFEATPQPAAEGGGTPYQSLLEQHPELRVDRPGAPDGCRWHEDGCLQRVRADVAGYGAWVADNRILLQRVAALSDYDHFANAFPARLDMPIPSYQALGLPLAEHALAFVQGQTDAALSGVCRDGMLGRKLVRSGDNLIGAMVGSAMLSGNAALLADMLAELPADHPLPATCAAAFAPLDTLADDACAVMLAEGRFAINGMRQHAREELRQKRSVGLLFDPEKTAARMAPRFAWYCGEAAKRLVAQDLPLAEPLVETTRWSLACVSNPIGCILGDIAAPAYRDYGLRLQDMAARLRVVNALLWLRQQAQPAGTSALASLPAALQSSARPVRLSADGAWIEVDLYERRQGEEILRLPLPASRLPREAAGNLP